MDQRMVFQVEGMDCEACERRLGTAVKRLEGIREARADHTQGVLEVDAAPGTDPAAVAAKVAEAGFTVTGTGRS